MRGTRRGGGGIATRKGGASAFRRLNRRIDGQHDNEPASDRKRRVSVAPEAPDRRIAAIAGRQKGNVTREQLIACGLTADAVDGWVRRGRLIIKHRGVYRLAHDAVPEYADELAAVLACGPAAVLSHFAAGHVWMFLPTSPGRSEPDVTVPGRNPGRKPGIRIHRTADISPSETTTHRGIPITTAPRTLLDLAAEVDSRTLERALNEAQVLRLATPSKLLPLLAQHPRHRGLKVLRAAIGDGGPPAITRSEAERRLLGLIRAAKLPLPRANARVGGYEVDLLWPEQRLIVEVDGFRYHGSRAAFERDRARDAELAGLGYRVIRVTWRQIADEPYAVVARIGQALGSSR